MHCSAYVIHFSRGGCLWELEADIPLKGEILVLSKVKERGAGFVEVSSDIFEQTPKRFTIV